VKKKTLIMLGAGAAIAYLWYQKKEAAAAPAVVLPVNPATAGPAAQSAMAGLGRFR
jgi:hypothetical protein